jgi:hypothetical protein
LDLNEMMTSERPQDEAEGVPVESSLAGLQGMRQFSSISVANPLIQRPAAPSGVGADSQLARRSSPVFPSVAEAVIVPAEESAELPARSDGGRILLVEDDPLVRSMARRSLAEAGFEVVEAANGYEALELIASEQVHLDAVLTDLAMRPDLPVVFMSGLHR